MTDHPATEYLRRNPPGTRYLLQMKRGGLPPKLFFGESPEACWQKADEWRATEIPTAE